MSDETITRAECVTFDTCGGLMKIKAVNTPSGWRIERHRQAPPEDVLLVSADFMVEHADGELYYFALCCDTPTFFVKVHYYSYKDSVPAFTDVISSMHTHHSMFVKAPSLLALAADGRWQGLDDHPDDIHYCRYNGTEAYRKQVLFTLLLGGSKRKKNRRPSSLYKHFKKGAPFAERRVLLLVLDFVSQPYEAPL